MEIHFFGLVPGTWEILGMVPGTIVNGNGGIRGGLYLSKPLRYFALFFYMITCKKSLKRHTTMLQKASLHHKY
jgi:hypothetical protein